MPFSQIGGFMLLQNMLICEFENVNFNSSVFEMCEFFYISNSLELRTLTTSLMWNKIRSLFQAYKAFINSSCPSVTLRTIYVSWKVLLSDQIWLDIANFLIWSKKLFFILSLVLTNNHLLNYLEMRAINFKCKT